MILDRRVVAPAAALVCALMAATQVAVFAETEPSFRVEKANIDLGKVVAGEVVTATFVFHNDGPEDVQIIRAKPS